MKSRSYTWKDIKGAIIRTFFFPAQQFENHVNFLNMMHLGGGVTLLLLVLSNIYPSKFSPVVIILCSLYTLYGLIIHPMKHRIYYEQVIENQDKSAWQLAFGKIAVRYIPILPLLFILYSFIPTGRGAELHTLDYVCEDTNKCINENEFFKNFKTSLKSNTKDSNIYFYSNLWRGAHC